MPPSVSNCSVTSHAPPSPSSRKIVFGKFLAHARGDVLPGRQRNFVTGVATKTIHSAPAPHQKRLRQLVPQLHVPVLQFHQIFPDHPPRAGADKRAVRPAQKPIRMVFLQDRAPAGVVDDHVQKNARRPCDAWRRSIRKIGPRPWCVGRIPPAPDQWPSSPGSHRDCQNARSGHKWWAWD